MAPPRSLYRGSSPSHTKEDSRGELSAEDGADRSPPPRMTTPLSCMDIVRPTWPTKWNTAALSRLGMPTGLEKRIY